LFCATVLGLPFSNYKFLHVNIISFNSCCDNKNINNIHIILPSEAVSAPEQQLVYNYCVTYSSSFACERLILSSVITTTTTSTTTTETTTNYYYYYYYYYYHHHYHYHY